MMMVTRQALVKHAGEEWVAKVASLPTRLAAIDDLEDLAQRLKAREAVQMETQRLRPSRLKRFSDDDDVRAIRRGTYCTAAAQRVLWRELMHRRKKREPAIAGLARAMSALLAQLFPFAIAVEAHQLPTDADLFDCDTGLFADAFAATNVPRARADLADFVRRMALDRADLQAALDRRKFPWAHRLVAAVIDQLKTKHGLPSSGLHADVALHASYAPRQEHHRLVGAASGFVTATILLKVQRAQHRAALSYGGRLLPYATVGHGFAIDSLAYHAPAPADDATDAVVVFSVFCRIQPHRA